MFITLKGTRLMNLDFVNKLTEVKYPLIIPIQVNACTGKMGMVVIEEAETAGLFVVPVSFGSEQRSGQICEVCGKDFFVQGPSNRESVLKHLLDKYPDLIVVDYTVSTAVNGIYLQCIYILLSFKF